MTKVISCVADAASGVMRESYASHFAHAVMISHLARSPRVDVLAEYIRDIQELREASRHPQVSDYSSSVSAIDLGQKPAVGALSAVIDRALRSTDEKQPTVVALNNSSGMRTLDVWCRTITGIADVLSLVCWNGGPYVVVPHGGSEAFFGTNPLAYGLPTGADPIVADFATSEIAYMDLRRAASADVELQGSAGLDSMGRPTTTASEVLVPPDSARLLPMGGGAKGSAIALLVEYLTGAFVGGLMGHAASSTFNAEEFGGFVLMLPDCLFRPVASVRQELEVLAKQVRTSRPAFGVDAVRLPGDNGVLSLASMRTSRLAVSDYVAEFVASTDRQ